MTINTLAIRGGVNPWATGVAEWTGTSTTWTFTDVTDTANKVVLYTGSGTFIEFPTVPQKMYKLELKGNVSAAAVVPYVSSPPAAPIGLHETAHTATSVTLKWIPTAGATSYEVVDVNAGMKLLASPTQPTVLLNNLIPDCAYTVQIRVFVGSAVSSWSQPITVVTDRSGGIAPGVYEYQPVSAFTFRSADSKWVQDLGNNQNAPLRHGKGAEFNDTGGINTTYFFLGTATVAQLTELAGSRIVSFQIYLRRYEQDCDPRAVLSHWIMHNTVTPRPYPSDPPGTASVPLPSTPTLYGAGMDAGQMVLGQEGWVDLPTGWGDALVAKTIKGIAWGGVDGRFQIAINPIEPQNPPSGTLRIVIA